MIENRHVAEDVPVLLSIRLYGKARLGIENVSLGIQKVSLTFQKVHRGIEKAH